MTYITSYVVTFSVSTQSTLCTSYMLQCLLPSGKIDTCYAATILRDFVAVES
uniref:Uncharacterized protein n=1 Tax=Arundo donax TaxID=35708 RepID=A0A0A8Y8H1_ARUDO